MSVGETEHARAAHRRPSTRSVVLVALLVVYLVVTLGVIFKSPLLGLDADIVNLRLRRHHPEWQTAILQFVILGQRGPATVFFLPYFVWRAWRDRSPRPLIMLVTALILLNLSVGVVKVAIGRLGPDRTHLTHDVFAGGDIYPSGHVSNAVMLYGLMAMVAVSYRRLIAVAAVLVSVAIGLSTLYLGTHWFSDVLGGWIAGGLILIVLPWTVPYAERCVDAGRRFMRRTVERRQRSSKSTPVSSAAASQSRAATAASFAARDEPTTVGEPRNSPIPLGP